MITQDNLVLTRAEPNGQGGVQLLYRVQNYGIAALSPAKEDVTALHWVVDVIKYKNKETLQYEVCHTTDLADKTLSFKNDKNLNEFLKKAFSYFKELDTLENMIKD